MSVKFVTSLIRVLVSQLLVRRSKCRAMHRKASCVWMLCLLSAILLQGEGNPVPKGKSDAIKGNRELIGIITNLPSPS